MSEDELVDWYKNNVEMFDHRDKTAIDKLFKNGVVLEDTLIDGIVNMLENRTSPMLIITSFGKDWFEAAYEKMCDNEFLKNDGTTH